MSWLDKLERRFGQWAIPQFALFIVVANALIYVLTLARPDFPSRLMLDPAAIHNGELWRIVTFLFVPPNPQTIGPLWMAFWLLLVYQFGLALEREWGEFRFGVFYAIGGLATVVAALWVARAPLSNVPLNTTLFLAFATLFPDFELLLFFVLPVRVKYLALLTWLGIAASLVFGSTVTRVGIVASLVNYAIFFGPKISQSARLRLEVWRNRRRFKS